MYMESVRCRKFCGLLIAMCLTAGYAQGACNCGCEQGLACTCQPQQSVSVGAVYAQPVQYYAVRQRVRTVRLPAVRSYVVQTAVSVPSFAYTAPATVYSGNVLPAAPTPEIAPTGRRTEADAGMPAAESGRVWLRAKTTRRGNRESWEWVEYRVN